MSLRDTPPPAHTRTTARRQYVEASKGADTEWGTPEADELLRNAADEARAFLRVRGLDDAGRPIRKRRAA